MTREEITALFARRLEAFNGRDIPALGRDLSEDSVVDSPFAGGITRGRAAIEDLYRSFFHAFPDAKLQLEELLIDGARVMLVGRLSGTDTGGLLAPPKGRSFNIPLVLSNTFQNGLIVHERRIYDFTGMLVQVGALKAKPI
jgi:predicted ester cyclase